MVLRFSTMLWTWLKDFSRFARSIVNFIFFTKILVLITAILAHCFKSINNFTAYQQLFTADSPSLLESEL